MAFSALEKMRIMKYLKSHGIGKIYYLDMCKVLEKGRKASNTEFLEFFTNLVLDNLNKDSGTVNMLSKGISCIETFLNWAHEEGDTLDSILLGKIRVIKDTYDEYLRRNELTSQKELEELINILNETLDRLYPVNNAEETVYYVKEINRLQQEVKTLSKELEDEIKAYEILEKKFNDAVKDNDAKNEVIQKNREELKSSKERIKELTAKVEELEARLSELTETNEQLKVDNEQRREVNYSLSEEIKSVRRKLEALEQLLVTKEERLKYYIDKERNDSILEMKVAEKEAEKEVIKKIILKKLANGGLDILQLWDELINNGYDVTREQLYSYLQEVKRSLNVVTSSLSTSPRYVIVPPHIDCNRTFDIGIPDDCKSYDILLVSDIHISSVDEQLLRDYNSILDYCAANNIKTVLNIGDFFCFKYPFRTEMLTGITGSMKLVERAISKLPASDGLYHVILGGNHDKISLDYGFDALQMLSDAREDFISIGYDHATITFNGQRSLLHSFMLHHPDSRYVDPVLDDRFDNESLIQSLEEYYVNNGRVRDDSYIDIVGHFHRSGLDTLNAICNVPSLRFDRYNKGAWHLKVYFDEKANIKYMVFKPLDLEDKLVATTEISFQRLVLSKKDE